MKCIAVLVALALAVTSIDAAECTRDQLSVAETNTNVERLQVACASAISLASGYISDAQAAALKVYNDKPCMSAVETLMKNQPDCTILGVNFKDKFLSQFTEIQSSCKLLGVNVGSTSTSSVSSSAPSSGTSSASSSFTVNVAALAAAMAVAAQL